MNPGPRKLLHFEGLRGIAALFVVIGHLKNMFFARYAHNLEFNLAGWPPLFRRVAGTLARAILPHAELCVWIFWVMSAYVLSVGYFRLKDRTAALRYLMAAAAKRYFRLAVPVVAVVLAAWAILAAGGMRNHELAAVSGPAEARWLRQSYDFAPDLVKALKSALWDTFFQYDNRTTYNNSLWTMEKELWGSFFIFALMAAAGHLRQRRFIYAFIAVIFTALQWHWLNAFIAGMLLCDFQMHGLPGGLRNGPLARLAGKKCFAFGAMAFLLLIAGARLNELGGLLHLLLSTAIVTLTVVSAPWQRIFSCRTPVFLGKISFGLYLIHIPVLLSLSAGFYLSVYGTWPLWLAILSAAVLGVAVSIAAGWLTWFTADQAGVRLAARVASIIKKP